MGRCVALLLLLGYLSWSAHARMQDLTHYYDDHVIAHPFHKVPWTYNWDKGSMLTADGDTIWWEANNFASAEHMGTHIDAPVHINPEGKPLDQIPLEDLLAPLIIINTREQAKKNPDYALTVDDVRKHEEEHGRIPDGAAVFMYSAWDEFWFDNDKDHFLGMDDEGVPHHPGFHHDTVDWLIKNRNIKGIGIDTLNFDVGSNLNFNVHRLLLGANLWGMENVAHMGKVPPTGATVQILPMNIKGASGAPCRVLAFWGDDHVGKLPAGGGAAGATPGGGGVMLAALLTALWAAWAA